MKLKEEMNVMITLTSKEARLLHTYLENAINFRYEHTHGKEYLSGNWNSAEERICILDLIELIEDFEKEEI